MSLTLFVQLGQWKRVNGIGARKYKIRMNTNNSGTVWHRRKLGTFD